jgi:hypothetical protein
MTTVTLIAILLATIISTILILNPPGIIERWFREIHWWEAVALVIVIFMLAIFLSLL